jgi:periplasmic divalent cation tolerance protein
MEATNELMIGWTTVASPDEAQVLARGLIDSRLAACVQVQGPVTAYYRWQGEVETGQEYRLTVKFSAARSAELKDWLLRHHPYETPQWLAVAAKDASADYANWVCGESD